MNNKKPKFPRRTPILRISLLSNADYSKICEVSEFKDLIMNEALIAIKEGVNKNKKSINLFEISDTKKCLIIKKEHWKNPLNEAMDYFISKEDYDKAIECRELIKKI